MPLIAQIVRLGSTGGSKTISRGGRANQIGHLPARCSNALLCPPAIDMGAGKQGLAKCVQRQTGNLFSAREGQPESPATARGGSESRLDRHFHRRTPQCLAP